ncbi:MAG: hypothetical protein KDK44_04250, partial [Chlamydiia bacterium]|nr:hypothetical protein [Chlamydiia bacterium]
MIASKIRYETSRALYIIHLSDDQARVEKVGKEEKTASITNINQLPPEAQQNADTIHDAISWLMAHEYKPSFKGEHLTFHKIGRICIQDTWKNKASHQAPQLGKNPDPVIASLEHSLAIKYTAKGLLKKAQRCFVNAVEASKEIDLYNTYLNFLKNHQPDKSELVGTTYRYLYDCARSNRQCFSVIENLCESDRDIVYLQQIKINPTSEAFKRALSLINSPAITNLCLQKAACRLWQTDRVEAEVYLQRLSQTDQQKCLDIVEAKSQRRPSPHLTLKRRRDGSNQPLDERILRRRLDQPTEATPEILALQDQPEQHQNPKILVLQLSSQQQAVKQAVLNLHNQMESNQPYGLHVRGDKLIPEAIRSLIKILTDPSYMVTQLYLSSNNVGDEGVKALAAVLKDTKIIQL